MPYICDILLLQCISIWCMDWAKIFFHYFILLLSYYSFEMVSMSSLYIKKVNTLHYMCVNKILTCVYKTRRNDMKEMKCSNMELPTQFNKICKYHVTIYSTPGRRHARRTGCFGYTRVGSISPMQDLTVWPPSCVISENSRSLAAIFFSDGNTRHCSRVYISRDLIWIKIVVGKTIYKQIVIILAIRFAVLSTVFQWK